MMEATRTSAQIQQIAKELIDRENTTGWGYEIGEPEHDEGSVWRLLVRWVPPGGDIFDGPSVIYVDEEQQEAWFLGTR
jgi:hypothetical protein